MGVMGQPYRRGPLVALPTFLDIHATVEPARAAKEDSGMGG